MSQLINRAGAAHTAAAPLPLTTITHDYLDQPVTVTADVLLRSRFHNSGADNSGDGGKVTLAASAGDVTTRRALLAFMGHPSATVASPSAAAAAGGTAVTVACSYPESVDSVALVNVDTEAAVAVASFTADEDGVSFTTPAAAAGTYLVRLVCSSINVDTGATITVA